MACQASLSVGFPSKEYWSGLPFPSTGDLPEPGIEPRSPALQADALPSEPPEKGTIILRLVQTSYLEFVCVCVCVCVCVFCLLLSYLPKKDIIALTNPVS